MCIHIIVGNIVVHLPKKNAKQHFDGLGLLTKLLSGKAADNIDITKSSNDLTKPNYKPLVEVLGVCVCVRARVCVCVCVTPHYMFIYVTIQVQMKAQKEHVHVLIVRKKILTGP